MLGYLFEDIVCSEKGTVFRERSLRKTASFEKQIMSKDKYLSIFFKVNGGSCVYYPSSLVLQHAGFVRNWGISLGYSSVLAGAY